MNHLDILRQLLEKTRKAGADGADAVLFESADISAERRMRAPEGIERSEAKAVGLRAFCGKRQAMVSSTDMNSLDELAKRAVAMAKAAPADPDSGFAPAALYPENLPELDLCDENEPSAQWLSEQCEAAEDAALSVDGITNSEGANAHYGRTRISLAIDNGQASFAESYAASQCSVSVSVIAGKDAAMQRDYDFTSARHRSDLADAGAIGKSAAERAKKRVNPRKIPTCRAPIVFDPRVSRNLLSIFASGISGNAVARGSSFLRDAMGKPVFAKTISIVDDPGQKRGLGSKPFDGEGVAGKKLNVVENGILNHWLLDVRTANKLKLQTTGNAARGIGSPPSPSSSNLYMENGSLSPEALMEDIEGGLYIVEIFGMGVNITTGDYSQGASGFWIDKGEITYPVSEITIAGKLQDMFASLTPASDLTFRYATNAPTLRIDAMTVAGT